jgi:uncharacterized protein
VLRLAEELKDEGGSSIALSGGEPLLHPEIRTIVEHLAPKLKVTILSNGTLIDAELAAFLADREDVHVQISLDGSTRQIHDAIRGEGGYDLVLHALEELQKAGLADRISLAATVMQQNIHDLQEIIRFAQGLGIPRVRFLPLRRSGRAAERWGRIGTGSGVYEPLFDHVLSLPAEARRAIDVGCGLSGLVFHISHLGAPDGIWCTIGRSLAVDVNGDVHPCPLMTRPEFKLGNVFHDNLRKVSRSEAMAELCKALVERRRKIGRCRARG